MTLNASLLTLIQGRHIINTCCKLIELKFIVAARAAAGPSNKLWLVRKKCLKVFPGFFEPLCQREIASCSSRRCYSLTDAAREWGQKGTQLLKKLHLINRSCVNMI